MDPLLIAAGVFLGTLPAILTFQAMIERKRGDVGRAWFWGLCAFILGVVLTEALFDPTLGASARPDLAQQQTPQPPTQ